MEMRWIRGLFLLLITCTWVLMTSTVVLSSSTKANSVLDVSVNSNVAGQNTVAVPSLSSVSMSSLKFSLSSTLAISSSSLVALSSGMAKEVSTPALPLVSFKLVSSLAVVSKSVARSSRPSRSESAPVAMSSSWALEQGIRTSVLPSVSSFLFSSLAISPSSLQRGYLSSVVVSTSLALDKRTTKTPSPSSVLLASSTMVSPRLVCPNMATLKETSGVLTSPYYPRRYPFNEKCSWKIIASKGERIVLVIKDIYIRTCGSSCTCDYLEIQNGSSSDGIAGRRRCRYWKDRGIVYHSAKDVLRVTFVSNGTTYRRYRGFKATYIKVKYNATTTACTSGEYLNGFSGFFSTPNFPRNFPQYSRCTWNITVPSAYIIKLSFLYFRLEPYQYRHRCYYYVPGARVTVTNVASDDGYQPFMLCGQKLPDPVYSVGNSVRVIFTSLNSQYPGFNATYTAITYSSVCPKMATLNETSGILTSPYYPRLYPSNEKCSWKITASKGERIVLVIEDIHIWDCGSSCTCDYLEIQNGLSSDGISGRRRCRSDKDSGIVYYSAKDVLRVTFVSYSDTYWQYSGFKATYIKVKYNATTTACISGEYLNGFSGFFSTPKFPSNYPQYSRCTWNITVPSGYIIKLSFFYFRLEPNQYIPCYYDAPGARVTVTNVASDDGYQPFMLCGQSLPPAVYSVGNSVQVIFTSLNSQYPGFIAAYTAISYSSVCPNKTILKETSGVITSPFYPRYYSNKQSCSWEIRARKGKRILLTIENMDIGEMDIGDSSGDWGCGEEWSSLCGYLEIQGGSISGYDGPKCRVCSVPLRANATYLWFKERIKVLFVSDGTIVCGTRFKLSYTQVTFGVSEVPHKTTTKVPPARAMYSEELENRSIVVIDIDKEIIGRRDSIRQKKLFKIRIQNSLLIHILSRILRSSFEAQEKRKD